MGFYQCSFILKCILETFSGKSLELAISQLYLNFL